jgi:hypothetical protein
MKICPPNRDSAFFLKSGSAADETKAPGSQFAPGLGPQPFQSGAPTRLPRNLQRTTLRRLGRVADRHSPRPNGSGLTAPEWRRIRVGCLHRQLPETSFASVGNGPSIPFEHAASNQSRRDSDSGLAVSKVSEFLAASVSDNGWLAASVCSDLT